MLEVSQNGPLGLTAGSTVEAVHRPEPGPALTLPQLTEEQSVKEITRTPNPATHKPAQVFSNPLSNFSLDSIYEKWYSGGSLFEQKFSTIYQNSKRIGCF